MTEVLHVGRNTSTHQHIPGSHQLESSFVENDMGVLVDVKLNMSQTYAQVRACQIYFAFLENAPHINLNSFPDILSLNLLQW